MPRMLWIIVCWLTWTLVGFGILVLCTSQPWALTWLIGHLCVFLVLMLGIDTTTALHVLSWFLPRTQVVRTMDYDGEIHHVLAYGEHGDILTAHRYWATEIGAMKLYPNGYVAGIGFIYFWEPLNVEARSAMHLTYDCVDWSQLKHMTWNDVEEYRFNLKQQAKLMNVTHI